MAYYMQSGHTIDALKSERCNVPVWRRDPKITMMHLRQQSLAANRTPKVAIYDIRNIILNT